MSKQSIATSQWNMRMPDKLKASLAKEATAARRDLTGHILYLLETHPERTNAPAQWLREAGLDRAKRAKQ